MSFTFLTGGTGNRHFKSSSRRMQQQPAKKQRMSKLKSFLQIDPESHFPLQNLPYGIFSTEPEGPRRVGVAIGDYVLDLAVIAHRGLFVDFDASCFKEVRKDMRPISSSIIQCTGNLEYFHESRQEDLDRGTSSLDAIAVRRRPDSPRR